MVNYLLEKSNGKE